MSLDVLKPPRFDGCAQLLALIIFQLLSLSPLFWHATSTLYNCAGSFSAKSQFRGVEYALVMITIIGETAVQCFHFFVLMN